MAGSLSIDELVKAVHTLQIALRFAKESAGNDERYKIARDACIQRFEYCIELAWKVSIKALGSTTRAAKPAVREMARADLISSAESWLDYIEARNNSSHSYDEDVARGVFTQIQKFNDDVASLIVKLQTLV